MKTLPEGPQRYVFTVTLTLGNDDQAKAVGQALADIGKNLAEDLGQKQSRMWACRWKRQASRWPNRKVGLR
jgi:hypothetical protein